MPDLLTSLGLSASNLPSAAIPTYVPHFIIANFILSYAALSTRGAKLRLGLDHNVSPRQDLAKYGARAVSEGKITQAQLDKLHRREGAHANAVEHFPFFLGATVLALYAKVPNDTVNFAGLAYTLVRLAYAVIYAEVSRDVKLSYVRSVLWWTGNFLCIRLIWLAGKQLNQGLL